MKVLIYSAKPFEIPLLKTFNGDQHRLEFTEKRLTSNTAMMALNFDAISIFSADDAAPIVLEKLRSFGVKYITLRSAGHDNIHLGTALKLGFRVANTPKYSPNAIAEHAMALFLSLIRHIPKAQKQTREGNFLLDELVGFDIQNKTIGVMGTGKIGSVLVKILHGFDCKILANDTSSSQQLIKNYKVEYISKDAIANEAEIIFICLPLTAATHHLFDETYVSKLKKKPIIVNVARGAIVKTEVILNALDSDAIGGYAADVYEREHGIFFYDRSSDSLKDTILDTLLHHPKVLITPHQAFVTNEALQNIAATTIENLNAWKEGKYVANELF